MGFWATVRDVWPETAEQRDWFHKLENVLDKLPKRLQPKAIFLRSPLRPLAARGETPRRTETGQAPG